MPKISIIMAAYNAEKFIVKTIENVLQQSFEDWELIIIDDGSTDRTAQCIYQFENEKITYYYQENRGAVSARNQGIYLSKGEYIIFLDSDDWWDLNCLEILYTCFLEQNDTIGVVHGNWAYTDESGWVGQTRSSGFMDGLALRTLLRHNPLVIHSALIRRDAILAVNGFSFHMPTLEDWELWIRLALANYKFVHVPILVAYYFWHSNSKSKNILKRKNERLTTLDRIWSQIYNSSSLRKYYPESYSSAYVDFMVSFFANGDYQSAIDCLILAYSYQPKVITSIDPYYRLIYYHQAATNSSQVGMLERFDVNQALSNFDFICAKFTNLGFPKHVTNHMYAVAYMALGLAYYHQNQRKEAKRFYIEALFRYPRLLFHPAFVTSYIRTNIPITIHKYIHLFLRR